MIDYSAHDLIVVLGPTASGKTRYAVNLAREIEGEILSADSRQFYRGMDIGTGKDLEEYEEVPYHLIDICDAGMRYTINDFYLDFEKAYQDVLSRGKKPILCGGSGLYIETALKGNAFSSIPVDMEYRETLTLCSDEELLHRFESLPEDLQNKLDSSTRKRMIRALEMGKYLESNPMPERKSLVRNPVLLGLDPGREERRKKISIRLRKRLEEGMIEEVETLLKQGVRHADLEYYGLEYKWISLFLLGQVDKETMTTRLETAIHQFAKRQMTWFRRMEKQGWKIEWI